MNLAIGSSLARGVVLTTFAISLGMGTGCDEESPATVDAQDGHDAHSDVSSTPDTDTTQAGDADVAGPPPQERQWWEFGQADPVLDEVTLYYLGHTWYRGADVAEVLETVGRVAHDDPTSWLKQWIKTSKRLEAMAKVSEDAGHSRSASMAYLRAATYTRAGLHRTAEPINAEIKTLAQRAIDMFGKYLETSGSTCTAVAIPYEGTTLPGYFCPAPNAQGPAPTILFHEGKDGWAEDGKYVVDEAKLRGYNVLLFDGPGIGKTIRLQDLPFRHDWEKVITPVIDFTLTQPNVDPDRIALIAVSLGGYLGPRAAAFEHRIKALVANPGVMDWATVYNQELSYIDPNLPGLLDVDPAAFNATIDQVMQFSPFLRWGMNDSMWHHGVSTPADLMFEIRRFTMDGLIDKIKAHTLVIDAEAETRAQSKDFYDQLTCPKDYVMFTAEEAAQFHVQPGATAILALRTFDWLDEVL